MTLVLSLTGLAPASASAGTFIPTGSLNEPRFFGPPTATLLADGRVLVALGGDDLEPTTTAEIYDPQSGAFTYTGSLGGSMWNPRRNPSSLLLPNGKVLFAGGNGQSNAELFNPATNQFEPTGSMNVIRDGAASLLLADGRALFVGGHSLSSAEIYDPATQTFASTGSMGTARSGPVAALLADGKVIVAGGGVSSAEIYDPGTGTFAPAAPLPDALHSLTTATTLNTGKVLITDSEGDAALYDPDTGAFSLTGKGFGGEQAVLLNSGEVLLVPLAAELGDSRVGAEVYDPETGSFDLVPSRLIDPTSEPAVSKLADGRVLIAGGAARQGFPFLYTPLVTAQVYDHNRNDPILTLNHAGSGTGTVNRYDKFGDSAFFTYLRIGFELKLVARPWEDSYFAGWQGDCSGTGDCFLTMDGARTVTAVFERIGSEKRPRPRRARLAPLRVRPRSKTIKRGDDATVKVTVRNAGNAAASSVRICPRAGSKAVKVGGCTKVGRLSPGASKKAAFRIKVAKKATKGSRATVTFKATAKGLQSRTGRATITIGG